MSWGPKIDMYLDVQALEGDWLKGVDPALSSYQDLLPQHQDCHELWSKKR